MNKRKVIAEIQNYLASELESNPCLEGAKDLLLMYKFLPIRDYGSDDVICAGTLIEVETNGTRTFCFMVPKGGGLITRVEGQAVQVITPDSPLGAALFGKRTGETAEVEVGEKRREYKIIALS